MKEEEKKKLIEELKKKAADIKQQKIDVVKTRLIKNYGYCEICSTDVLNFVASIFARGDVRRK